MWKDINVKDLSVDLIDGNNEYHSLAVDNNNYTYTTGVNATIKSDDFMKLSRYYPSSSQMRTFGHFNGAPVSLGSDGVWTMTKAAYYHKDKTEKGEFSGGTVEVNGTLEFKVNNPSSITVWRNNKEYKFDYYSGAWHSAPSFWDTKTPLFKDPTHQNGWN